MKKLLCVILISLCFAFQTCNVFAVANNQIRTNVQLVEGYPYKTVLKHYQPYYIGFVNENAQPVLFSSKSQLKYIKKDGTEYIFPDNKIVYKKSRKRDVGRYFLSAMPCAVVGGAVIGFTFGLGLIPGLAIAAGGSVPYISAYKYNSNIASNIYIDNKIPLNLDPKQYHVMYVFLPKKNAGQIDKIIITNLSLNNSNFFDITIPTGGV